MKIRHALAFGKTEVYRSASLKKTIRVSEVGGSRRMAEENKPEKSEVVDESTKVEAKSTKKAAAKKSAPAKAGSSKKAGAAKKEKAAEVPAEPKPYAVIRSGGKQYLVSPGDKVLIDQSDDVVGESVKFTDVLATGVVGKESKILSGNQKSLGVTVTARVVGPVKSKKVIIFKKRRRGGYTKKQGHRQGYVQVVVESIA